MNVAARGVHLHNAGCDSVRLHATNLPEYFQVVRVHSTSFGELGAPFASLNLCDSN